MGQERRLSPPGKASCQPKGWIQQDMGSWRPLQWMCLKMSISYHDGKAPRPTFSPPARHPALLLALLRVWLVSTPHTPRPNLPRMRIHPRQTPISPCSPAISPAPPARARPSPPPATAPRRQPSETRGTSSSGSWCRRQRHARAHTSRPSRTPGRRSWRPTAVPTPGWRSDSS